jgi:hypothetical protein
VPQQDRPHSPNEDLEDSPLFRKIMTGLIVIVVLVIIIHFIYKLYKVILKYLSLPPTYVAPLPQNMELAVVNNPANV